MSQDQCGPGLVLGMYNYHFYFDLPVPFYFESRNIVVKMVSPRNSVHLLTTVLDIKFCNHDEDKRI